MSFILKKVIIFEALVCRCDVCVNGPPVIQNLKEEAKILMQVIAAYSVSVMACLPIPCGFIILFTCESMHNSIISSLEFIVMGKVQYF